MGVGHNEAKWGGVIRPSVSTRPPSDSNWMGRYGEIARELVQEGPGKQGKGLIEAIAVMLTHFCFTMTHTRVI
ncbi:hypothetical protein Y032_0240g3350 [Ancylostoma ceylanicum]|uniref:Uncharacterized protein n=1 Tax=Ancylostoma ceylanicum TaxID=53326 RepID=A0A016SDZ0_9BILA|nr:hypothetical protein Y032_0240g3350 [Ancylostoma ceylanicum]